MTLGLAVVSFVAMWLIATPGFDNTRAYEGTDTRAGGLLVGAALAMLWRPGKLSAKLPMRGRVVLDSAGVIALIAIALLLTQTDEYSMFLYRGGILLLSLATALLIAVSTHPASLIGKAIGVLPLRWIGERSYGIYLWHLPVIVFLPESVLEDSPWRSVLLCVIIVALAALSWSLVEDPIRRRGLLGRSASRPRAPRLGRPADPLREPRARHAPARQRPGPGPRGHGRAHRPHRHGSLDQQLGRADHRRWFGGRRCRLHTARPRTRDAVGHRHDVRGSGAVGHDDQRHPSTRPPSRPRARASPTSATRPRWV